MSHYRIKQLEQSDWQTFKQLRLEALKREPAVFCPSTKEQQRSDEEWQNLLGSEDFAVFALLAESEAIGISGIVLDRDDPDRETALLVMSYVREPHRGKGLSRLFFEARLSWAKAHPRIKRIRVAHRKSNLASAAAIKRNGFVPTGEREQDWPDGSRETLLEYELRL